MPKTTHADDFKKAISDVVDAMLENDDDDDTVYDPLKEALLEQVMAISAHISAEHAAELAKVKKAATEVPKVTKKSSSGSGSGSGRAPNAYSSFVGYMSKLKPGPRANYEELANFEVTVTDNFSSKSAACAKRFYGYQDQLLRNEQPILGQTMTMGELYDLFTQEGAALDKGFSNAMTLAGLMWGLTSKEDHTKIAEIMATYA